MKILKIIRSGFQNFYLSTRFFIVLGGVIVLFLLSFNFSWLFPVAQAAVTILCAATLADTILLFIAKLTAHRVTPKLMSLGDENSIYLELHNHSNMPLWLTIVDEIPDQFQIRDFEQHLKIAARQATRKDYKLLPKERGEYFFDNINVFMRSILGLAERRMVSQAREMVPVYPSVIQMKKYELIALSQISHRDGVKKMRRIGHSYEFDQIKNYVQGDDVRTINWKATARRGGELMVNQYEDERAQQIYCLIDKSRVMRMPFEGLTLMDHAINTSLVISNIILQKKDKAGLFTFSDKLGTALAADQSPKQLERILTELYHQQEGKGEASYEMLYYAVRRLIKGRSLLLLYTNFENMFALERVLPTLRLLNDMHLLVVIFFVNTEIEDFTKQDATLMEDIYVQTVAQKFLNEKVRMAQTLRQHGIQTILTRPENLSINSINKYLELKSRGLI
ncbi:MAG: hypothetical protein RL757_1164 [Bacteroidota bacterium]|jgi:uncharacterized protein (DUF58 family)